MTNIPNLQVILGQLLNPPGFDEVLLPGEPEQRNLADQSEAGILVDDTTWEDLRAASETLGISFSLSP